MWPVKNTACNVEQVAVRPTQSPTLSGKAAYVDRDDHDSAKISITVILTVVISIQKCISQTHRSRPKIMQTSKIAL